MASHMPDITRRGPGLRAPPKAILGPIAAHVAFVIELTLVPLLLPAIRAEFGLSISELAWVFNAYGIAVAIGVLLGGWFGDVLDARRVFVVGVGLFVGGALLTSSAGGFETLILGRALQGLGGGIFAPLVPILLTRAAPDRPGHVLIVWGSVAGYVAAFGPLLYGSFFNGFGWTLAFVFNATVAVVALVVLVVPQVAEAAAPRRSRGGGYLGLLGSRDLWLVYIYVFCTYGAITYYLFQLPIWLSEDVARALSIGFALSVLWLTFSAVSSLLRNLVDRQYLRPIMVAAPFLIALGLVLSYFSDSLPLLLMSTILVGSGLACSNAPSTQMILRIAPEGVSAFATSLDITCARLGGIATVAILAQFEFGQAALTICVSCAVAALCAGLAARRPAGAG